MTTTQARTWVANCEHSLRAYDALLATATTPAERREFAAVREDAYREYCDALNVLGL